MADYDVFNIEEKWFGEAEPVNYEAGVQDGVPTRTPTIILDEDNGAVHVCNTPNPTIRNTGWTKYSTGGSPVENDHFKFTFSTEDDVGPEMSFTCDKTYEELASAYSEGKTLEGYLDVDGSALIPVIFMGTDGGDPNKIYMFTSVPVVINSEASTMCIGFSLNYGSAEILGSGFMTAISGGGSSELLATPTILVTIDGQGHPAFTVGPIGDSFSYNRIYEAITEEDRTARVLANFTGTDPSYGINSLLELRLTQLDKMSDTVVFENHMIDTSNGQNQIIFNRLIGVEDNSNTVWSFEQKYVQLT